MTAVTPWTEDRVETLTTLWNEGMAASQIALKLGQTTRSAVLGKLGRMGLLGTRPVETGRINYRQAMRAHATIPREPRPARPPRPRAPREHPQASGIARRARTKPGRDYANAAPVVIDASNAKPWTERVFGECAYPISGEMAETLSCCQPTDKTYCPGHAAVMFQPVQPTMKQTMRIGRMAA